MRSFDLPLLRIKMAYIPLDEDSKVKGESCNRRSRLEDWEVRWFFRATRPRSTVWKYHQRRSRIGSTILLGSSLVGALCQSIEFFVLRNDIS